MQPRGKALTCLQGSWASAFELWPWKSLSPFYVDLLVSISAKIPFSQYTNHSLTHIIWGSIFAAKNRSFPLQAFIAQTVIMAIALVQTIAESVRQSTSNASDIGRVCTPEHIKCFFSAHSHAWWVLSCELIMLSAPGHTSTTGPAFLDRLTASAAVKTTLPTPAPSHGTRRNQAQFELDSFDNEGLKSETSDIDACVQANSWRAGEQPLVSLTKVGRHLIFCCRGGER